MVEAGGIEPPSERPTTGDSPSAGCVLFFAAPAPTAGLSYGYPALFPLRLTGKGLKESLLYDAFSYPAG